MTMTTMPDDESVVTERAALEPAASLCAGLGDASRLAIVQHLSLGEHRVVDLTHHLGLAQSTVSRHLACLLDCGIVTVRAQGRASLYALAHPEATTAFLAAAEALLDLTGDAAVLYRGRRPQRGRAARRPGPSAEAGR